MDMFNVINGSSVCNSCQNFVGMIRKHEENDKCKSQRDLKIKGIF